MQYKDIILPVQEFLFLRYDGVITFYLYNGNSYIWKDSLDI